MATEKKPLKLLEELRGLTDKDLTERIKATQTQLQEHYRALSAQELPSSAVIRKTRKEIATALTVMTEKQKSAKKEEEK